MNSKYKKLYSDWKMSDYEFDKFIDEIVIPEFKTDKNRLNKSNRDLHECLCDIDDQIELTRKRLNQLEIDKINTIKKIRQNREFYLLSNSEFVEKFENEIEGRDD